MSALYISDLDASGLAESDERYQQCAAIAATLMDIADSPTEVQGRRCNRVPIVSTGNNFRTFYMPLISKVWGGRRGAREHVESLCSRHMRLTSHPFNSKHV